MLSVESNGEAILQLGTTPFPANLTPLCFAHSSLLYVPSAVVCVICPILLYTYLQVAL